MRTTLIAALAALPSSLPAQEDAGGSITGTLGLDDAIWYVQGEDFDPGSFWQDTDQGRRVQLVGTPLEDPEGSGGALVIEFLATGNPSALTVSRPQVTYRPEDAAATYRADGINVDLSLTALEIDGDLLALAGNVVATMTPGGSEELIVTEEPSLTVDGNFQATISRRD